MKYISADSSFFSQNRARFALQMVADSVAVFHSSDQFPRNGDQFHVYRQQSDLFYLTGIEQDKTILLLSPSHPDEKLREVLFIEETSELLETWNGKRLLKVEATKQSGIRTVMYITHFNEIFNIIAETKTAIYCNSNDNPRFKTDVPYRDLRFMQYVENTYPDHQLLLAGSLMSRLRTRKQALEVEMIKEAVSITNKAFKRVMSFVKPECFEYEIEAEIIHEFIRSGARGHAYEPIVASGKNALYLHYIKNSTQCVKGDLLLLDFGAEYYNYAADLSRTIPVSGRYTKRQADCYNAVLDVMKKTKQLMVVDNTIEHIQRATCTYMEEKMISLGLFTANEVQKQDPAKPLFANYYMHGVSHFLGLDVHDLGSKQEPLKPGMVLTCEPGLYIKSEGIGIRIENNILITENGPIDLMQEVPVEIEEIEELMSKKK